MIILVINLDWAQVGDFSFPNDIDGGHLVIFSRWNDWCRGSKMALVGRAGSWASFRGTYTWALEYGGLRADTILTQRLTAPRAAFQ